MTFIRFCVYYRREIVAIKLREMRNANMPAITLILIVFAIVLFSLVQAFGMADHVKTPSGAKVPVKSAVMKEMGLKSGQHVSYEKATKVVTENAKK